MKYYLIAKNWFESEEGQDLIEYALLAAFVAIALIALLPATRAALITIWNGVNAGLEDGVSGV